MSSRRKTKKAPTNSSNNYACLPFSILLNPSLILGGSAAGPHQQTSSFLQTPSSNSSSLSTANTQTLDSSINNYTTTSSPTTMDFPQINESVGSPSSPPTTNRVGSPSSVSSSRAFSTTNQNVEKQQLTEMQLQWIESMRQEFLKFIEKNAKLGSEMEVKMIFLEHFFDPIIEKVPTKMFTSTEDVHNRLDMFCKVLIKLMMPFDWIEIEQLKNQTSDTRWFYIRNLASKLQVHKLFKHEYLKDFIQEQSAKICEKLSNVEELSTTIQTTENVTLNLVALMEEIKLICNMFSIELGDWFMLFEFKKRKKWISWFDTGLKNQCIPKYILGIYKRKKESTEKAFNEFVFKKEDLNQKYIIESDWHYSSWISKEHTSDWYLTYTDMPNVMQWNSDEDRSVERLGLNNTKIVGYVDVPVSQVVKSNHYDSHLQHLFGDVNWYSFTPINMAHSIYKYPHALMVTTFKFGLFFSPREIQNVFSSRSVFNGKRMVENAIVFKSSDWLNNKETKNLIKVPFIGGRVFNMVDKNRTRYVEVRTLCMGGLLGKKILMANPLAAKKLCLQNYNGVLHSIKEAEEKFANAMPSVETNYLAKLLDNYCKVYCNIDLENDPNVL